MHSKTVAGQWKTVHTYKTSKSLISESKRCIFIGGVKFTKKIHLVIFPLWDPFGDTLYLFHLGGSHSLEHICGNVYMGVNKYKIKTRKLFFSKLNKKKYIIFKHFYHFSPPAPLMDFLESLRALLCPEGCRL